MDKKHPDADTPVDPKYFLMGYNLIKCAQCGVPWDEHARDLACDRYRPPVDLRISALPEVKKIVTVNLAPDRFPISNVRSRSLWGHSIFRWREYVRFLRS